MPETPKDSLNKNEQQFFNDTEKAAMPAVLPPDAAQKDTNANTDIPANAQAAAQTETSTQPRAKSFVASQKAVNVQKSKSPLKLFAFKMQRGANDAAARSANQNLDKLPPRVLLNAVGQLFYRVGLQCEYLCVRTARAVRHACHAFLQGVLLLVHMVARPLLGFFRGLWNDLSEPVIHFFTGFAHIAGAMKDAKKQGEKASGAGFAYLANGLKTYRHLFLSAASYLLPLSAAAVLFLTIHTVLGTDYSLKVEYKDQLIGFVENENVWENAQKLIRSRIKASGSTEEWSASPTFGITAVDTAARSTSSNLADTIVAMSPEKIQQATGLYVGDTLVGVCTEGKRLQNMLDDALANAVAQTPDARAEFVQKLGLVSGLYFTTSLTDFANIEQTLQATQGLQVKTILNQTYEEELAFNTVETESDKLYKGVKKVQQKGVNGRKRVNADVVSIDGMEVERRILSEEPLEAAVDKIVLVGTKELPVAMGNSGQVGGGALSFPVPGYSYITTRFGGGHRGVDICAPYGTPIYACDGGTVVEAGSHYSWGNYIKIAHGNGMATLYAHCSSLLVGAGQSVARGQAIGLVGATGAASGNHCHLEVYAGGGLTNPMNYISG
ncbi:MAG: peptidoglycan DD-metalloendopeptidase family protein [Ruthenibacterium sp.]